MNTGTHIEHNTPAVELINLHKSFTPLTGKGGKVRAVDGVDLTIDSGEIVALLGPNGAGKTTALDMILGFTSPTSGTCLVYGGSPRHAVQHGRVSAVLQTGALLDDLTVRETLAMIATQHSHHMPIDQALDRAGATSFADRKVSKCSGGEQQRLRFALALLPEPDLLILDEPTAGMDVNARRDFWAAMHAEAERGRTIVFATHYLEEADQFADRIVVMGAGRILADGTTEEIRALGGLRTVSVRWNSDDGDAATALAEIPGAESVRGEGERTVFTGPDTDAIAHHLLTHTKSSDLLIVQVPLEEAFVGLTHQAQQSAA
ncbi:ABC transporter ATP-binding protein [Kocuria sp. JC486]|uniref:ABC transporter ATP-binding protein n=1 Tax=Kocuria soli TaxID=2485125 RepID=A0A3N3ZQT7_9MICC|nr:MULTISPECIES: ABC transporter ATP-binding protein [Kocuria]NHU86263.1 ABC transporter ATP-binding protein [Kocuria sp. JC486]ROZ63572.1 ABC transporter ATP-binding protein [Kocuria soli]